MAGVKLDEQLPVSIADQTRSETVPQEVKLLGDLRVSLFADVTTNNLRLLWMKLELTVSETFL